MQVLDRLDARVEETPALKLGLLARTGGLVLLVAALTLLSTGCASIVVYNRPVLDRGLQDVVAGTTPPPAESLALVQAGMALDRKHPEWAMTYYRDAALKALPQVQSEGVSPQLDLAAAKGAQGIYRRSIEYILETANRRAKAERVSWTDVLARAGIGVRGKVHLYETAMWEEALPTRQFEIKGIRHRAGRGGLGAPVVLYLDRSRQQGRPATETSGAMADPSVAHFPNLLYRSAAAVLRPGAGPSEPPAVLELHDPVSMPDLRWQPAPGASSLPLAYDLTVPLGRQLHVRNLNLVGAMGVFFPSEYDGKTGIYMLDPYEPGKIPVVFVHGLMSSPEAWTNAMNDLRGNPELRKRYQFWMFFYSTGNPLLASGARFRKALNEIRSELDPGRQDPAFDRMVLIGHSMGGLLSQLAISRSGQTLWNTASRVPPDQIEMDRQIKDLLMEAMFFEPVPTVRRVVFISTPHRGSPLGDDVVGRVTSRLIRVPADILQIRETLAQANGRAEVSEEFRGTRYATGVAQLGVANPVLRAINQLPMSADVPYHSIVGYNGKEPLPEGGDGVVPYKSAHIEGALSELVVSSDHSAQETDNTIREMRRILTIHYNEYALERRALSLGEKPAPRITRPSGSTPVRYALSPPPSPVRENRIARFDAAERASLTR
jgi:pimeloyl-ACP methyl ester carboxylesterase